LDPPPAQYLDGAFVALLGDAGQIGVQAEVLRLDFVQSEDGSRRLFRATVLLDPGAQGPVVQA